MIRRFAIAALAVLAVGFVVTAPAEAGGGGGGKKTATIRVQNKTGRVIYAVANAGAFTATPSTTGYQTIANDGVAAFKVAPGTGYIYASDNTNFAAPGAEVGAGQYIGTGSQTGYMIVTDAGANLDVAGSARAF
jgi:hypothetical protein